MVQIQAPAAQQGRFPKPPRNPASYLRRESLMEAELVECRTRLARWMEESRGWCRLRLQLLDDVNAPGWSSWRHARFFDAATDETLWAIQRTAGRLLVTSTSDVTPWTVDTISEGLDIIETTDTVRERVDA